MIKEENEIYNPKLNPLQKELVRELIHLMEDHNEDEWAAIRIGAIYEELGLEKN
jgi:hypothetical protein